MASGGASSGDLLHDHLSPPNISVGQYIEHICSRLDSRRFFVMFLVGVVHENHDLCSKDLPDTAMRP